MRRLDEAGGFEVFSRSFELALRVVAGLFVLFGVIFYFCGSRYLDKKAELFGLTSVPGGGSLQSTMAAGARVVFDIEFIGPAIGAAWLFWLSAAALKVLIKKAVIPGLPTIHVSREPASKLDIFISAFGLLAWSGTSIALLFWVLDTSSEMIAYRETYAILSNRLNKCEDCSIYVTKNGVVTGTPLFQTATEMYVQSKIGVELVRVADLVRIEALTPADRKRLAEPGLSGSSLP